VVMGWGMEREGEKKYNHISIEVSIHFWSFIICAQVLDDSELVNANVFIARYCSCCRNPLVLDKLKNRGK